jgi:hypothetical protein
MLHRRLLHLATQGVPWLFCTTCAGNLGSGTVGTNCLVGLPITSLQRNESEETKKRVRVHKRCYHREVRRPTQGKVRKTCNPFSRRWSREQYIILKHKVPWVFCIQSLPFSDARQLSWMRLTAIFTDSVLLDITITIRRVHHDPPMKSWRHALGVTHSLGDGGPGKAKVR